MDFEWLNELNPQQREAVTYGDGPLLVIAGAGSGKTRTLAYRVAYLVERGIPPESILLLTFTRRAAEEMLRRAERITAQSTPFVGKVWGGTFHATANRLLRMYHQKVDLPRNFTIMDQSDAEDLMDVVKHDLGYHSRDKRFPRKSTCLSIYSRLVNGTDSLEGILMRYFPWCLKWQDDLERIFKHYILRKRQQGVLDYDDLLLYWERLLRDEEMAHAMSERFSHILVDEYQDTNPIQARILMGMRRYNTNIMVVGDDAQSIYGFRAATVKNILDFPKHFPGTHIVKLEQNYRSVMPILHATNKLISQAKSLFNKELWSERKEGNRPKLITCKDEFQQSKYVIERILHHYEEGIPLHRQAVLFRAGHHSDTLEVELVRANIPYHKFGGMKFLEAAHVKDLLCFLRVVENPRDEIAWFRVLKMMRGIGKATASKVVQHVAANDDDPRTIRTFKGTAAARESMEKLARLIDLLLKEENKAPAVQVSLIREFYEPLMEEMYENPHARRNDLEHLEEIASRYPDRRRFLTELTLDPPSSTSDFGTEADREKDYLVLSTIHSAKGCEWDVVILINAADGLLPSEMSFGSEEELEEELRLTYVAMTRAKDHLYVTWPMRCYHRQFSDRHNYMQLCRFLTEEVCDAFDVTRIAPPEEDFFDVSTGRIDRYLDDGDFYEF